MFDRCQQFKPVQITDANLTCEAIRLNSDDQIKLT